MWRDREQSKIIDHPKTQNIFYKQKGFSYKSLNQSIEALGNMIQKFKKSKTRKPFDLMPKITEIKEKIAATDCNEDKKVELLQFLNSLTKESEKKIENLKRSSHSIDKQLLEEG